MGNCSVQSSPYIQVGNYEFDPRDVIHMSHHGVLFQGTPVDDKFFEIAIKQVYYSFDERHIPQIESVMKKLRSANHENVVHYVDYYYDNRDSRLYIMVDFCAHGTLKDLMRNDLPYSPLQDIKTAFNFCRQLISGVISLHGQGIIHQNLIPQNILIHYDTLKISDYGPTELECLSVEGFRKKSSIYLAPELFAKGLPATEKCDIWSLGVLMYQIMYKTRPVEVNGGRYIVSELKTGRCADFDDLVQRCLEMDPEKRPNLQELKEHPFVIRSEHDRLKEFAVENTALP